MEKTGQKETERGKKRQASDREEKTTKEKIFFEKKKTKKIYRKKKLACVHDTGTSGRTSASVQKSCFCLMPSSDEENWKKNKFRQRTVDSGGSGSNEKIGLKRRNVPQQTDEVKMKKFGQKIIWKMRNDKTNRNMYKKEMIDRD